MASSKRPAKKGRAKKSAAGGAKSPPSGSAGRKKAEKLAVKSGKLEESFGAVRKSAEELRALSQAGGKGRVRRRKAQTGKGPVIGEVETEAAGFLRLFEQTPAEGTPRGFGDGKGGDTTSRGPALTDIFGLVADGLVEAQKALDKQSLDYVSQISDPRIAPALYAIPSVKAAAKLALTVDDQSNILVKLFGSPADKTNYSESTLTFDIVATPPPPAGLSPAPSFLVIGEERDRVIQTAMEAAPTDEVRARAVVFRIAGIGAKPYLLLLTDTAPRELVQVFRVSLDAAEKPVKLEVSNAPEIVAIFGDIAASLKAWERSGRRARAGE